MRQLLTGLMLAAACLAASAADDHAAAIANAKDQVGKKLRDPASAQYRNITVLPAKTGVFVCGEVNAKNAYGGYVGFSPFMVSDSTAILANDGDDAIMAVKLQLITHVCARPAEGSAAGGA